MDGQSVFRYTTRADLRDVHSYLTQYYQYHTDDCELGTSGPEKIHDRWPLSQLTDRWDGASSEVVGHTGQW